MTAQIHEWIVYNGERMSMAFCPSIPEHHPRIVATGLSSLVPGAKLITACWRGYQGSWEIRDGRLYLVGLRGKYALVGTEPILADWFTGTLKVPKGEVLRYLHQGSESIFEEELHIAIEEGVVMESSLIDNRSNDLVSATAQQDLSMVPRRDGRASRSPNFAFLWPVRQAIPPLLMYAWFVIVGKAIWWLDPKFVNYDGPSIYLRCCSIAGVCALFVVGMLPASIFSANGFLVSDLRQFPLYTSKKLVGNAAEISIVCFVATLWIALFTMFVQVVSNDAAALIIRYGTAFPNWRIPSPY